jgi:hypothetical protein
MLSYTNTIHTKQSAVALAEKHFEMDNFIQGTYWDNDEQKGCSVGCMVKEYVQSNGNVEWHEATEALFGVPRQLSYLQDRIFEMLPIEDAKKWTVRFMSAIPEGKDLSMVTTKLLLWIFTDEDGLLKFAKKRPDVLSVFNKVASLYQRKVDGETITKDEWLEARDSARKVRAYAAAAAYADAAAYAAADAAAYAAAYAAAAAAAYADAAAYAAAYAAADAAAYAAADADATRKKFVIRMADKLISILESL